MSNDSIKENADWLLEAIDHRFYFRGEVTCVHVCMCACVHVCMCACVHVCMCACVHALQGPRL